MNTKTLALLGGAVVAAATMTSACATTAYVHGPAPVYVEREAPQTVYVEDAPREVVVVNHRPHYYERDVVVVHDRGTRGIIEHPGHTVYSDAPPASCPVDRAPQGHAIHRDGPDVVVVDDHGHGHGGSDAGRGGGHDNGRGNDYTNNGRGNGKTGDGKGNSNGKGNNGKGNGPQGSSHGRGHGA